MKLCFIAGGNSVHSQRWTQYFFTKGHTVSWLSLGVGTTEGGDVRDFHCIQKSRFRPLNPFLYAIRVRKFLKKTRPDILHVHQVWIDGIIGAFTGFHPFIITPWGSDVLLGPKSFFKRIFIQFALRKADLVTCDGENTRVALIRLGVLPERIKIVRFGTDTQRFKPEPRNKELEEHLGLEKSLVVISLRSLKQIYNIETLIQAVPSVVRKIPNAVFLIAGKGPEEQALKNLTLSLGLTDAVKFIGNIAPEKMSEYLNMADVYVSTALTDSGLSASTAEAMACGLPVVVTNTGDNKEWVREEENGYIIPVRDSNLLAERIIQLLGDEHARKRMGRANRERIEQENNYDKEMGKMEKLYEGLLTMHA